MLDYQRQDIANYDPGSGQTIDLSQVVSQAREAIRGKTLEEAILQLALIGRSPSTTVLRQHVEEIAESNSLHYVIPLFKRNEEGKVWAGGNHFTSALLKNKKPQCSLKCTARPLYIKMPLPKVLYS